MSRIVAGVAILFVFAWAAIGTWGYHSHWSDTSLQGDVEKQLKSLDYLGGNVGSDGKPRVRVKVNDHWAVIEGKVDNEDLRADIGRRAAEVPGMRGVENKVEALNTAAFLRLKELLATPPTNAPVSFVFKEQGTVVISGGVTDQALKQKIEDMAYSIRGVQFVENHLGEDLRALIEQQIRDIMRLNNIYFDFNQYTIRDDSRIALDAIAKVLKEYPGISVRIEGHTDSIASEKYNQWLSQKRAEAVVTALAERGLEAARMQPAGFGEVRPIAPNSSPEGRAENRRIEFHVIGATATE